MTLDRFGHLFEDELDAVAARLDAAARVSPARHGGTVVTLPERPAAL